MLLSSPAALRTAPGWRSGEPPPKAQITVVTLSPNTRDTEAGRAAATRGQQGLHSKTPPSTVNKATKAVRTTAAQHCGCRVHQATASATSSPSASRDGEVGASRVWPLSLDTSCVTPWVTYLVGPSLGSVGERACKLALQKEKYKAAEGRRSQPRNRDPSTLATVSSLVSRRLRQNWKTGTLASLGDLSRCCPDVKQIKEISCRAPFPEGQGFSLSRIQR